MKKSFFLLISAGFFAISSLVSIAAAAWSVAKEIESPVVSETNEAVCYIAETGQEYTTIERALKDANNQTIYVKPNLKSSDGNLVNIEIKNNIIIKSGVTLILPYEGTSYDIGDNFLDSMAFADANETTVKNNRKILVSLVDGADITIKNGGTLIVGGYCGSKGVNGPYAELNLGMDSHILVEGNLSCYGYIKESSVSNNSNYGKDNLGDENRYIEIANTGYLSCSLSMYDSNQSGSALDGLNNAGVCPINIFDLSNLQTYVKCNYGGKIIGIGRERINSIVTVEINQPITIVSSNLNEQSVFYMTSSGYVSFEYAPSNLLYSNDKNLTYININSSVSLGYLRLSQSSITIDTSKMYIPISYKFHIILDGSFDTNGHDIKFMPGSSLHIGNFGSLQVKSKVVFYKSTSLDNIYGASGVTYPKGYPDAELVNNGLINLTSSGCLGAYIKTENVNGTAKVDLTNATLEQLSVTSPESTSAIMIPKIDLTGTFLKKGSSVETVIALFLPGDVTNSSIVVECVWEDKYLSSNKLTITKIGDGNYYSFTILTSLNGSDSTAEEIIKTNTLTTYNVDLETGTYVKIIISDYTSVSINDGTITYNSNQWYLVTHDFDIKFEASFGYTINFSLGGSSGAGSQTFTITYGETSGNLTQTFTSTSYKGSLVLKQNTFFTIKPSSWGGKKYSAKVTLVVDGVTEVIHEGTGEKWGGSSDNQVWEVIGDYFFTITNWSACVDADTLITLANGTTKLAKDIKVGDMIQTWNFETGKLETQPVIYSGKTIETNATKITLYFSDGTSTSLINQQSYFDLTLMDYSLINRYSVDELIGHKFYSNGSESKTLVSYEINEGEFEAVGILSAYNLNFIADSLLSAEGLIVEHTFFDVDDNMKYNPVKMEEDVLRYGLYDYYEWSHIISEEQFNLLSGKYYKVYVGKGYCSYEYLVHMVEHFAENPDNIY